MHLNTAVHFGFVYLGTQSVAIAKHVNKGNIPHESFLLDEVHAGAGRRDLTPALIPVPIIKVNIYISRLCGRHSLSSGAAKKPNSTALVARFTS